MCSTKPSYAALTGDHEGLLARAIAILLAFLIKLEFLLGIVLIIAHLLVVLAGQEVRLGATILLVILTVRLHVVLHGVVEFKLLLRIGVVDAAALALLALRTTPITATIPITTARTLATVASSGAAQKSEPLRRKVDGLDLPILVLEGEDSV